MKQKIYSMIAFILLNILAIIISVYFDHEIFARRFKEFMWVIDLLSMPFFIAYFIVINENIIAFNLGLNSPLWYS